jgi:hypothetical protein
VGLFASSNNTFRKNVEKKVFMKQRQINTFIGFRSANGGRPSAISRHTIPSDHTSTFDYTQKKNNNQKKKQQQQSINQ